MNSILNGYLSNIDLRDPQQFRNMVVLPVFTKTHQPSDYLTLTEALQQRIATITEVSNIGQVSHLKVTNGSELRLLLVQGEELIGAKQNRTLNTSILVAGKSETIVPVSCTEAGRWSHKSSFLVDGGYVSPHKLRKITSSSVAASLKSKTGFKSDQKAVWDEVAHYCLAVKTQSPTSAMADAISAKARDLDECLNALKPLPNQTGIIVLVNGEVAGADMLSSARAYQSLHPKFIRSYAMEALVEDRAEVAAKPQERVAAFIDAFNGAAERVNQSVGCGEDRRFEGTGVAGAALMMGDQVVHLNLYRN